MISGFDIYLVCKLDEIRVFCFIMFAAICILIFAYFTFQISAEKEPKIKSTIMYLALIFLLIGVFTPSTKQACAIMVIPAVCNAAISNEKLQELPNNILDLANDWIKELSPKKSNNQ